MSAHFRHGEPARRNPLERAKPTSGLMTATSAARAEDDDGGRPCFKRHDDPSGKSNDFAKSRTAGISEIVP